MSLLMQDDPAITCEIRRQELGRSHGLERVWRLWRLWACLQEMASDVVDPVWTSDVAGDWNEHMWWRGEVLSIIMDDRGLEEVSCLSNLVWCRSVLQVFLKARGDCSSHPELCLPRRSPVSWMDPWRLAQSLYPNEGQFMSTMEWSLVSQISIS